MTSSGPDPPPADEMLTLLSARLPESLRARLAAFTAALRTREGSGHVSQKALPEYPTPPARLPPAAPSRHVTALG